MSSQLPIADSARVRTGIRDLLRRDRRAVVVLLLLSGAAAVAGLVGPRLLGTIIDRVQAGTATPGTVDAIAVAVVGAAVVQLLLNRAARYAAHRFGERTLARLREGFVDTALALPARVAERVGTGELVTRATADVATVGTTLRDALPEVLLSTVHALLLLGAVFLLDPLLGLCGLVSLPGIVLVSRWYLRRARDAYLAEGAANAAAIGGMADTAAGARTVEVYDLARRRVRVTDDAVDRGYRARVRTLNLRSVLFPVAEFSHALPLAVVLVVGGLAYLRGELALGAVVAAALYLWQLIAPLDRVLMWLDQVQNSAASFARVVGVELVADDGPPAGKRPEHPLIEVRGLGFAYVPGRDVLRDIDLTVQPGQRLAVVGPSGAGKSTLGKVLSGMDRPDRGTVRVGGVDVAELPPGEVVLVTQEHHVFVGTLRDNLAMAAPTATDDDIRAALTTVEADWALTHGLDTDLDPTRLDAAKAQQVALARVLLANPHTLILDEATSLLDPRTARRAERAMAAVLRGRTVIAMAHRLHTAEDADRIAVMADGRITELGTHHTLLADNGTYATLWHSWHGR
ncbi:ABC transporter ATP-binding protein [Actinokineospora auranticolor]|uniref:ABC-type multidrug transport system fused ATPase/permease subunit n=1 Tax=Actinokineospora auranticolor TaxID=155976 RepID=A0A2S6GMQ6_9PSEU|nr:ABC transporter ATP-binding protein [Actinokineospora auranticolor]PPK66522.1 ABC-type multidrug transport system fused ATPase/permease subunit [Actinokineospora auranticolor]